MSDPEIERALVERASRGDVQAYGRLVGRTERLVRAAVAREIRDPGLAEDAIQETFLRAFRKLPDLRDAPAFATWIHRIATTTARNELRRRRYTFADPDTLPDDRQAPEDDGRVRVALLRALVRLSARDRRLIERYYRGGWSTARLAREEGRSEAAIRKRVQRARDQMRRDIAMTRDSDEPQDLPARIVELLGRPLLVDLPENPVGAVWEEIRATRPDDEEIELPEIVPVADIVSLFGPDAVDRLPPIIHRVDAERILRFDLTVPMLLHARGRPDGTRLMCAGRVYRNEPVDARHVEPFHQAEVLWIGRGKSAWDCMAWFEEALDRVLPGRSIRVVQVEYPLYAGSTRGYEVQVRAADEWLEIAGFSRFDGAVLSAIGLDPAATRAVSLGMGLERLACLKYGIPDVRQVDARRVDE